MRDLPVSLRRYLEISGEPANSAFHTSQVSISFGESIEPVALRDAWAAVSSNCAALRTTFHAEGHPVNTDEPSIAWQEFDWQASPPEDLGQAWQTLVQEDAATPIACESEAACRITLIRLPNGGGHALWSFHAALLDDTSISTVLHRWLHAYDCLRTGEEAPRFEPDSSAAPSEPDDSWKPAFEGISPSRPLIVLPLPDPAEPSSLRRSISHTFERSERGELAAAAEQAGGDFRSLLGAAWTFVLARATSSPDALLLVPSRVGAGVGRLETFVLRRQAVESHDTSGNLVRSFAAETPPPPADPSVVAQALGIEESALAPSGSFIYRDLSLNDRLQLEMPRWMAADTQLFQKTPGPLTLRIVASDRPEIALDYDPRHLSDAAARSLFETFRSTLAVFATDPALALASFALPGAPAEVETTEAPTAFRSLVAQGIHEMFADAASETPDSIAVEMDDEKLTFAQLNNAANQLARLLRKRGVESGSRIAIDMPRSPRWVIALLGAMKAGGSVVPAQGETALADVRAWIVDSLPEGIEREQPVIQMQADAGAIANEKSRGVQSETQSASEAIAWKSGETELKFTHEDFADALQSFAGLLALDPADRVLQFAPTNTFAAIEETLAALLSGATVVLRSDNRWATRTAFQEFVEEKGITTLCVPTPFWNQWIHYLAELSLRAPATLRLAVSIGDRPAPQITRAWRDVSGETRWLHRTTSGIACGLGLSAEPAPEDPLAPSSLGRPDPATIARIVDSHGLVMPVGLAGRVEIASTRHPEKFSSLGLDAFVSPEGMFYARKPLQLLLAGFLPDAPAEAIRHAATAHPQIIDAHAEQRLIAARKEWCLWVVPRDSERGEPHDFRDWLTEQLRAAPRRIRALPRFPLDDSGDIDLAALAELEPEDFAAPTARKGNELEERVRQAISRALGGRRIELDEILTDGRTKPLVAKLLLEAVSRDGPRVQLEDFTTGFSVRSLLRNVRGRRSGADSAWTPLQPLRASGKLPPVVFIHDLDGTAKPYAAMVAHLGEDQPCYAITARGLADPAACHTTVEEMARTYVEALRVFDANGPYRLAGYGFGGLVAFEMARQLHAAGGQVSLLVALATEPPGNKSPASFLAGGWKRALPFFGRNPVDESNGRRRKSQDTPILRANHEAARKYVASLTPLSIHIFAPEHDFPSYRSVQTGWSACSEDAHFYQVPCTGPQMMEEPAVEAVAEAIGKLARSEELSSELDP